MSNRATTPPHKPGPGRPRSRAARRRVLRAALELLEENGLTGVTIAGVADRAKVGKPTIYRYWPNALAVTLDALMEAQPDFADTDLEGSALQKLRAHLVAVVEAFSTGAGKRSVAMIAAADEGGEIGKAFRHNVILKSRNVGRDLALTAIDEGTLRANLDVEVFLDQLYGPIFFRLLVGHEKLEVGAAERFLEAALEGARKRSPDTWK